LHFATFVCVLDGKAVENKLTHPLLVLQVLHVPLLFHRLCFISTQDSCHIGRVKISVGLHFATFVCVLDGKAVENKLTHPLLVLQVLHVPLLFHRLCFISTQDSCHIGRVKISVGLHFATFVCVLDGKAVENKLTHPLLVLQVLHVPLLFHILCWFASLLVLRIP